MAGSLADNRQFTGCVSYAVLWPTVRERQEGVTKETVRKSEYIDGAVGIEPLSVYPLF